MAYPGYRRRLLDGESIPVFHSLITHIVRV